jgi:hypothetical protein
MRRAFSVICVESRALLVPKALPGKGQISMPAESTLEPEYNLAVTDLGLAGLWC